MFSRSGGMSVVTFRASLHACRWAAVGFGPNPETFAAFGPSWAELHRLVFSYALLCLCHTGRLSVRCTGFAVHRTTDSSGCGPMELAAVWRDPHAAKRRAGARVPTPPASHLLFSPSVQPTISVILGGRTRSTGRRKDLAAGNGPKRTPWTPLPGLLIPRFRVRIPRVALRNSPGQKGYF
jgi:hypothetical protein